MISVRSEGDSAKKKNEYRSFQYYRRECKKKKERTYVLHMEYIYPY